VKRIEKEKERRKNIYMELTLFPPSLPFYGEKREKFRVKRDGLPIVGKFYVRNVMHESLVDKAWDWHCKGYQFNLIASFYFFCVYDNC
jgi:hypothetical protein